MSNLVISTTGGTSGYDVSKGNLRRWRWNNDLGSDATRLEVNQVLIKVCKFALTSNNVTYARLGEPIAKTTTISYWRFFETPYNHQQRKPFNPVLHNRCGVGSVRIPAVEACSILIAGGTASGA
jgi:hypothetical protein